MKFKSSVNQFILRRKRVSREETTTDMIQSFVGALLGTALMMGFLMKKQNIKSIRLVTSNYHILRSLVEFERWNNDAEIVLHPVFSEKIASSWWKSVDSFCFLAREYNKLLYALVRAKFCNV